MYASHLKIKTESKERKNGLHPSPLCLQHQQPTPHHPHYPHTQTQQPRVPAAPKSYPCPATSGLCFPHNSHRPGLRPQPYRPAGRHVHALIQLRELLRVDRSHDGFSTVGECLCDPVFDGVLAECGAVSEGRWKGEL